MYLRTFASGSSGNCALVVHGGTAVLVDAGISMRRITACLRACGAEPGDLSAILVTHEHSDHVTGLGMMGKHYGIPILATEGTGRAISARYPGLTGLLRTFRPGEALEVGDIRALSFATPHDTPQSVGFRLEAGGGSAVIATDLGYVPDAVLEAASGADAAMLESNHDLLMLRTGPYPAYLKSRILSRHGHLSNDDCGVFAAELARRGTKKILLAHLSRENNTPQRAFSAVEEALTEGGFGVGRDVELAVAPANEMSETIWLT